MMKKRLQELEYHQVMLLYNPLKTTQNIKNQTHIQQYLFNEYYNNTYYNAV